jgi:uncharacterized membrane protein YkvA (DUF1232 family)
MKRFAILAALFWRLRHHAKFVWAMVREARTPLASKLLVVGAAVYLISPIDLVPDFFAGLGWLDDAAVVAGLLALAYKLLPADVHATLRARTGGAAPGSGANMNKDDARVVDMVCTSALLPCVRSVYASSPIACKGWRKS